MKHIKPIFGLGASILISACLLVSACSAPSTADRVNDLNARGETLLAKACECNPTAFDYACKSNRSQEDLESAQFSLECHVKLAEETTQGADYLDCIEADMARQESCMETTTCSEASVEACLFPDEVRCEPTDAFFDKLTDCIDAKRPSEL